MRGQMGREDVQDDVQCTIRIQVKIAYEPDNALPGRTRTRLDGSSRLRGVARRWRVRRTQAARQLGNEFAVAFGLLAEEVELVLLVAARLSIQKAA